MWRKQKIPCFVFEGEDGLVAVVNAFLDAGYIRCRPFLTAVPRHDEVASFRRVFRSGGKTRQVHVQIVCVSEGGEDDLVFGDTENTKPFFVVFAHTEPPVHRPIKHLIAAFRDKHCFGSGAKVVKRDLANILKKIER